MTTSFPSCDLSAAHGDEIMIFFGTLGTSLGPVYEFVCISFRTDNLNCYRAS